MKEKTLTLFVLIFGLFTGLAMAQNRVSVSGTVTDEAGVPLPGVSVVVKGSSRGVSTDFDGKYEIQASSGEVLVFSFVGFTSQEKVVGGVSP